MPQFIDSRFKKERNITGDATTSLLSSIDRRIKFSALPIYQYLGLKERIKASFRTIQNNNFFLTKNFASAQDREIFPLKSKLEFHTLKTESREQNREGTSGFACIVHQKKKRKKNKEKEKDENQNKTKQKPLENKRGGRGGVAGGKILHLLFIRTTLEKDR